MRHVQPQMVCLAILVGIAAGITHIIQVVHVLIDTAHRAGTFHLLRTFVRHVHQFRPGASHQRLARSLINAPFRAQSPFTFVIHVVEAVVGIIHDIRVDYRDSGVEKDTGLGQRLELPVGIGIKNTVMVVAFVGGQYGIVHQIGTFSPVIVLVPNELRRPYAVDAGIFLVGVIYARRDIGVGEDGFSPVEVERRTLPMYQVPGTYQVDAVFVPHAGSMLFHVGGRDEIAVRRFTAPDIGVTRTVFYLRNLLRVENLVPVQQYVEHATFVFFRAECEVGDFLSGIHEAVQVTVAVVIGCQHHRILHFHRIGFAAQLGRQHPGTDRLIPLRQAVYHQFLVF